MTKHSKYKILTKYELLYNSVTYSRRFPIFILFCFIAILSYVYISVYYQNEERLHIFYTNEEIKSLLINENLRIDGKRYRINTRTCKIIDLPLYDPETKRLFTNRIDTVYSCERPVFVKIKRFNETSVHLNWSEVGNKPFCYYRELSRGKDDNNFNYGQLFGPINETTLHLPDYHFVHIVCYKNVSKKGKDFNKIKYDPKDPELIHDQIIPLIPFVNKTSATDVPNVLLLAIDATSYVNFKRHFLKTEKFLNKNHFFELRGYNKVGHNTYPNMIPFLTGHHSKELVPNNKLRLINFDDWPLIWKKYSQKGFVTTFLEEMSWCGLFNFNLKGFKRQPTDYQLRPFHMQIGKQKYNHFCYLDKTETQHCLDWTYDYVKAMNKRKQKYFAYISISEMTHYLIEAGHYLDVPYNQLLTKLFDEKLLENTLLIFFSDHGYQYPPLRETHTGEVENRLPFIFIHLPENFNSEYAENLRRNQYRLTTPFDIHATLTHLIEGKPDHTLPHGLSLFDKVISDDRDCNTSSISEMYCSCNEDIQINNTDIIKPETTVPKIVTEINSFTSNVRSNCSEYTFHSIHKLFERRISRPDRGHNVYIIQFYTNPGMALFETVLRSFDNNTRFEIIGEITRINLYGNQSHCLNDKLLNNYCFCTDLLQSNITVVLD